MVAGMDQLRHQLTAAVALLALAGCGSDRSSARAAEVVPRDVALARFRSGIAEVKRFSGGATSRDGLIRAYLRALEHKDVAALRALTLTKAEFAWLYYETTPESRPPYDLEPGLMWFLVEGHGEKGLARALDERGGRPLAYAGRVCPVGTRQGENLVWTGCALRRVQAPGDTVVERLFGPIVARGGRFKFVSLTNKLD